MNERARWLLYFAQVLGFLTGEEIETIKAQESSEKEIFENLLKHRESSQIKSFFARFFLSQRSYQQKHLSKQQYEKLSQVVNIEATWSSLLKEYFPIDVLKGILEQLWTQNILDKEELGYLYSLFPEISLATIVDSKPPTSISKPSKQVSTYKESQEKTAPKKTPVVNFNVKKTPSKKAAVNFNVAKSSQGTRKTRDDIQKLGAYDIIKEIGVGGMGKVYKAHHPKLDKTFAIKVMLKNEDISSHERKRFLTEAKLTAKLRHPNIVKVHDVREEEGVDYIVMDFVAGHSLAQVMRKQKLPIRKALDIMEKVARAMGFAHEHKIIHRDLKPANIMIEEETGKPLVMDFGLAKDTESSANLTKSGAVLGTPRYMAPEQAGGKTKEISIQTDVYALGAIFYEILTRKPIVAGNDTANILYQILYSEVVPPRQHNPQLAIELESICLKALEKEASKRYANGFELCQDIERYLNGEVISVNPESFWKRSWKKVKRYKLAVLGTLIFVCVVIGASIWQQWQKTTMIYNTIGEVQKFLGSKKQGRLEDKMLAFEKMRNKLAQIQTIAPNNKKLLQCLFDLELQIGDTALEAKEYFICEVAYEHSKAMGKSLNQEHVYQQKIKTLYQQKEAIFRQQAKDLEGFMVKIKKNLQGRNIDQVYLKKVIKMPGKHTLQKLLKYLKIGNMWQRIFAIKGLGRLGDTYTKIKGKDTVEWLLEHLTTLDENIDKDLEEAVEVVWALAWLKDPRALEPIMKKRWKLQRTGQDTLFWTMTRSAISLIPAPESKKFDFETFHNVAINKLHSGKVEEAIIDFRKAIQIMPHRYEPYLNLASAMMEKNEFDEAIKYYSKTLELRQDARAYNNRGTAWHKKDDFQKALNDYNRALAINPKYVGAYTNRGQLWKALGKPKRALKDYNKAIKLFPSYGYAYVARGQLWKLLGKYKKAIVDLSIAMQLLPSDPSSYYWRAEVYSLRGEWENALYDYSKAIYFNSKHAQYYQARANAYMKRQELKKAARDYIKAVELEPKRAEVYQLLAIVYQQMGKIAEAVECYRNYIRLLPNDPKAAFFRAVIADFDRKNKKK